MGMVAWMVMYNIDFLMRQVDCCYVGELTYWGKCTWECSGVMGIMSAVCSVKPQKVQKKVKNKGFFPHVHTYTE